MERALSLREAVFFVGRVLLGWRNIQGLQKVGVKFYVRVTSWVVLVMMKVSGYEE